MKGPEYDSQNRRLYFCKECDYKSKWRTHLSLHVLTEHKGIRFTCEVCGYQAKENRWLKKHMKNKHG